MTTVISKLFELYVNGRLDRLPRACNDADTEQLARTLSMESDIVGNITADRWKTVLCAARDGYVDATEEKTLLAFLQLPVRSEIRGHALFQKKNSITNAAAFVNAAAKGLRISTSPQIISSARLIGEMKVDTAARALFDLAMQAKAPVQEREAAIDALGKIETMEASRYLDDVISILKRGPQLDTVLISRAENVIAARLKNPALIEEESFANTLRERSSIPAMSGAATRLGSMFPVKNSTIDALGSALYKLNLSQSGYVAFNVGVQAANALANIRTPEALAALQKAIADDDKAKAQQLPPVLESLVRINVESSIQYIQNRGIRARPVAQADTPSPYPTLPPHPNLPRTSVPRHPHLGRPSLPTHPRLNSLHPSFGF